MTGKERRKKSEPEAIKMSELEEAIVGWATRWKYKDHGRLYRPDAIERDAMFVDQGIDNYSFKIGEVPFMLEGLAEIYPSFIRNVTFGGGLLSYGCIIGPGDFVCEKWKVVQTQNVPNEENPRKKFQEEIDAALDKRLTQYRHLHLEFFRFYLGPPISDEKIFSERTSNYHVQIVHRPAGERILPADFFYDFGRNFLDRKEPGPQFFSLMTYPTPSSIKEGAQVKVSFAGTLGFLRKEELRKLLAKKEKSAFHGEGDWLPRTVEGYTVLLDLYHKMIESCVPGRK